MLHVEASLECISLKCFSSAFVCLQCISCVTLLYFLYWTSFIAAAVQCLLCGWRFMKLFCKDLKKLFLYSFFFSSLVGCAIYIVLKTTLHRSEPHSMRETLHPKYTEHSAGKVSHFTLHMRELIHQCCLSKKIIGYSCNDKSSLCW